MDMGFYLYIKALDEHVYIIKYFTEILLIGHHKCHTSSNADSFSKMFQTSNAYLNFLPNNKKFRPVPYFRNFY